MGTRVPLPALASTWCSKYQSIPYMHSRSLLREVLKTTLQLVNLKRTCSVHHKIRIVTWIRIWCHAIQATFNNQLWKKKYLPLVYLISFSSTEALQLFTESGQIWAPSCKKNKSSRRFLGNRPLGRNWHWFGYFPFYGFLIHLDRPLSGLWIWIHI